MARRRPNAELRTREYLTEPEIEKMIAAVKGNRWAQRDATMLLVAFRHGLRVAELIDLRWDQIEFEHGRLHVRRAKNGTPSVHPIHGDELRALRKLQREQDPVSPFVFTTERGGPFSVSAFQRLVLRAGETAKLGFPASAYAAARLWLRAGKQGRGYARHSKLSRPQVDPAHGALYRIVAGEVQGFLALTQRYHHQPLERRRCWPGALGGFGRGIDLPRAFIETARPARTSSRILRCNISWYVSPGGTGSGL
jgi:hypothetical protein